MYFGFTVPGPVGAGVGVGVGVGPGVGVGVGVGVGAGETLKLWLPELDPFPPVPLSEQLQVSEWAPAVIEFTVAEQESPCDPGVLQRNPPSKSTVALSLSTGGTLLTLAVNVTDCPATGEEGFKLIDTEHDWPLAKLADIQVMHRVSTSHACRRVRGRVPFATEKTLDSER